MAAVSAAPDIALATLARALLPHLLQALREEQAAISAETTLDAETLALLGLEAVDESSAA